MKKLFAIMLAWVLALSLAACGGGAAPSQSSQSAPQSEPAPSQSGSEASQGDPASSQIGAAPSQSAPAVPQGEPEKVDLNEMAKLYSEDAAVQDRLSGKVVEITGYIQLDKEKDELYLWGVSFAHDTRFGDNPVGINVTVELPAEDEALLRGAEYNLAFVTLTGQIGQGMAEEKVENAVTTYYRYTMSGASYVTDVHEVTGILNKDNDGDYWIEGVGYIRFLNKADVPPAGTEVTLSGKVSYGGDFREAVVVK